MNNCDIKKDNNCITRMHTVEMDLASLLPVVGLPRVLQHLLYLS